MICIDSTSIIIYRPPILSRQNPNKGLHKTGLNFFSPLLSCLPMHISALIDPLTSLSSFMIYHYQKALGKCYLLSPKFRSCIDLRKLVSTHDVSTCNDLIVRALNDENNGPQIISFHSETVQLAWDLATSTATSPICPNILRFKKYSFSKLF